jgi:DNA-nicking Smr family endonuclease
MSRRVSDDERALWRQVAETVTPLAERRRVHPRASVREVTKPQPVAPEKRAEVDLAGLKIGNGLKASPHAAAPKPFAAGLDKRSEQRLKRGQLHIDARLDLHGHSQAAAQGQALAFLARAVERGSRCLLIITGKGKAGGGVLRQALPLWLEASPFAHDILRLVPAAIQHGGEGAFYVLLKRKRESA